MLGTANAALVAVDNRGMIPFRVVCTLGVALTAPWLWVAKAHAEGFAQLGQVPGHRRARRDGADPSVRGRKLSTTSFSR
jgi:hypothetical protein